MIALPERLMLVTAVNWHRAGGQKASLAPWLSTDTSATWGFTCWAVMPQLVTWNENEVYEGQSN